MWNYERLHGWFAQDVEKKDMIFRQFLPDAHTKKHRGLIRQQLGNYLIWLIASAYEAKTGLKQEEQDLADLVKNLHRHKEASLVTDDLNTVHRYMAVTPSPLGLKDVKTIDFTAHSTVFLDSIRMKPQPMLSKPLGWWRYNSARNQLAEMMQAEMVTFIAGFKLGKFVRDTPSVEMRLRNTPIKPGSDE